MEREQLEKMTRDYQMLQEQLQSLGMQREQLKEQKEKDTDASALGLEGDEAVIARHLPDRERN